jgi:hypothetical protein
MAKLSTSFTLGKAGSAHGANVEHNNREFLADNIDANRICDNVTYVQQNVREAYDELFGESLNEYNAKQKKPCRRINDYYEHISASKREEAFYEIVLQFGDVKSAGVGTSNGELAKKMLDEYMQGFKERNPNLHVFNAVLHMDEASPHLHINFIPYYKESRKNGLSKGVSMKAALIEQGFNPKGIKQNQLVMWEDSEMKIMEQILKRRGHERDVKKANHAHMNVEEYKESQDLKKLPRRSRKSLTPEEFTAENVRKLELEKSLLKVENKSLVEQRYSPYKSFYYSQSDKQSFVMNRLDELDIPFRETENGFEAQDCYVAEIRKIEKEFKPVKSPHRDKLRDDLDKIVMQSKNFVDVLERLKKHGYEVKEGKYVSVKPKFGSAWIRIKSLGENYSEQALRNRIVSKQKFENNIDNKIKANISANRGNSDTLEMLILKTVKHYTIVFAADVLPVRKIRKNKLFEWTNDAELDKLSELNKKINAGATLETLRNKFAVLEKSVTEKEKNVADLNSELRFFTDLHKAGIRCFENGEKSESDAELLAKHKITAENYPRIAKLIEANKSEIAEIEKALLPEREKLKDVSDTLTAFEKIAGGTFVQSLIDAEKNRRQSDLIPNGLKHAN